MSKISTIYTAILGKLATLHTLKTRIPNPYLLPDNIERFLCDGYGLKVGGSSPQVIEYDSMINARTFSVVYTREMVATESDTDVPDDISSKLLEDVYEVQNMFYAYDKMLIPEILNVELGSCSEIAAVKTDSRRFLSIEVSFEISIRESL